jgi:CRP-like cAMP-binding protein
MTNFNEFIEKLIETYPISVKENEEISKRLIYQTFKAKQQLLYEGDVSDRIFFVLEGLVRSYYYDERQHEHNTLFVAQRGFIFSVTSYANQQASFEYIEALEHTKVCSLKKEDIDYFISLSSNLALIYARMSEQFLRVCDHRHRTLQLKPEERYRTFKIEFPKLESRLKVDQLASFLGIGRSTLLELKKNSPKIDLS